MRVSVALPATLALASTLTQAVPTLNPRQSQGGVPALPFEFTYLFTTTLNYGRPATDPIPIPGGYTLSVPIVNGTVEGPAANGTVLGGTAYPRYYNNDTLTNADVILYGKLEGSEEEGSFQVQEESVTTSDTHTTRIFLSVLGERYKDLNDGYILAHVDAREDGSGLSAQCWLVTDA